MSSFNDFGKKLGNAVNNVTLLPAVQTSAQEVVEKAKQYCPVDTGKLRESINMEESGEENSVAHATVGEERPVYWSTNKCEYDVGAWIEYGTGEYYEGRGRTLFGDNPPAKPNYQPFMRPALWTSRNDIIKTVKTSFLSQLKDNLK